LANRPDGLFAAHTALLKAAMAAKDERLAREQVAWLKTHRGRAYVEGIAAGLPAVFNIADTTLADLYAAEINSAAGDRSQSRQDLQTFTGHWPMSELPATLRRRVTALGDPP
jgi:hypothetical protein